VDRIDSEQVAAFLAVQTKAGLARQTIINRLNLLGGIFRYAVKRGWASANPVAAVDRPKPDGTDADIRFLDVAELEAVIRAVENDKLGKIERVLYLTAAMTGLRQGELVALRWRDVDWTAGLIRVRRNYTRGLFGTPKSRRSSRAVPMADRVATELAPLPAFLLSGRRRPRLLPPGHRQPLRRLEAAPKVQAGRQAGRCPRRALPRSAAHLRHQDGRSRRADAELAGVDGPRRPDHHAPVRGLLTGPGPGRSLRRGRLRGGHQFGHQFEHK
jgi:integrase